MIAEDYVSYEVSRLLKEKGFDGQTHGNMIEIPCVSYITHQMAMKWLRDIHGIIITIDYDEDEDCENNERYGFTIYQSTRTVDLSTFQTFEEAVEAALKYCLTKLI